MDRLNTLTRQLHIECAAYDAAPDNSLTASALATRDCAAAIHLRDLADKVDECAKLLRKAQEIHELRAALWLIAVGEVKVNSPEGSGTLELSMRADSLPTHSKNPAAYYAVCEWLGLSGPAVEQGIVQIHYKHIQAHIANCMRDGVPLPTELGEVVAGRPRLSLRRHRANSDAATNEG